MLVAAATSRTTNARVMRPYPEGRSGQARPPQYAVPRGGSPDWRRSRRGSGPRPSDSKLEVDELGALEIAEEDDQVEHGAIDGVTDRPGQVEHRQLRAFPPLVEMDD